jgi:hypothetical protein
MYIKCINFPFSGYRYFLCLVDLFNNFVYVAALKTKESKEVFDRIQDIIKNNNLEKISTIGSDEGSEFIGNRKRLADKGINLYILKGEHKAFQAELYIRIIKERLFKYLRANFKNAWPKVIQAVVSNINHTENKALNYLVPADLNSPSDDSIVREERRGKTSVIPLKKTIEKNLQAGTYVYADFPDEPFTKAFDFARGMVFIISHVNTQEKPYLYSLKELNDKPVKKKYYSWQLRVAPDPYKTNLPIEKILEERKKGSQKEYLVKWLFYDSSYNSWVPKKQLVA